MASPADRRYTPTHEWHKLESDGLVTLGISQFAVEALTDITFLDLKKRQGPIHAGEPFGEIESVKTTSELYCAVDGTVEAFNQEALDNPAIINQDPYGKGWMLKVRPSDPQQLAALLAAADYDATAGKH